MFACGWKWAIESLSIGDGGGFLAHLLLSVITGTDTKDQQVSVNSLAWVVMDNGLALD